MEKLPGEGQPNIENKAEQETKQPLTAEDLKQRREGLEQRVAAIKKQKEDDIKKQLSDREAMIAEDGRLVPLLEEAEGTLEYFETQNQQGLLTDKKDVAELESLKTLVASLREQKDATLQKYDAIMSNPDVYEKVWEEAHGEKMTRELKDRREGAAKEITQRVEEIGNAIEKLSSSREYAYGEVEKKKRDLDTAVTALRKVIDEATKGLDSGQYKTSEFLKDLRTPDTYGGYITGAEQYRKSLGLFKGKEKAAVDYVLRERYKFDDADKKAEEVDKAKQYLGTLDSQVDKLAEQYKTLVLDAWTKENEIKKEFPAEGYSSNDLPHTVHYGLEENLERRSGLGKMEGGRWIPPYDLDRSEKGRKRNEEEKFNKLNSLFHRIEETAGRYLYMHNPEKEK